MSSGLSDSSHGTRLIRWVGSGIAIILLLYLFSQQGWDEIGQAVQNIPFGVFLGAFALMLMSRLAVVGRWYILLRAAGLDVSIIKTLRLTFAGLFASNFLPTTIGGDVVRLTGAVQLGLDGAISAASLVVDRLVGMLGMALALPFGLGPLWAWFVSNPTGNDLLSEASPLSGLLAIGDWGKGVIQKISNLFKRIIGSLTLWLKQPKSLRALLFSGVHMLGLFGMITVLLNAMDETMSIWLVGGLWSFVYFVTILPISINGYGVQEVAMTFFFTEVGGISIQSGLTIAILFRTLMMLASLPGAVFVPGIMAGAKRESQLDYQSVDEGR